MKPELCDHAIHCDCSEKYEKLYELVRFIATDYVELSHDKVRWQRDDYIKRARKLLEGLER